MLPAKLKPTPEMLLDFFSCKKNPISVVMEYCQKKHLSIVFKEAVVERSTMFGIVCCIEEKEYQLGVGRTKKDARADAAKKAFTAIAGESYEPEPKKTAVKKPVPAKKSVPAKKCNTGLLSSWRANDGSVMPPSCEVTNYYGPYPRNMLANARFELLKLVDMREGYGYNRLKLKCGIFPDGRRDRNFEGWGAASDYFSCSGEPEKYLLDFDFDANFYAHLNSKMAVKNIGASKPTPEATVTLEDYTDDIDLATLEDDSESELVKNKEQAVANEHGTSTETASKFDVETNGADTSTNSHHESEHKNDDKGSLDTFEKSGLNVDECVAAASDGNFESDQNVDEAVALVADRNIGKEETSHSHEESPSVEGKPAGNTLDRSVIVIDDNETNNNVNEAIVIDDSIILSDDEGCIQKEENANNPLEINDSSSSSEDVQFNGCEMIIDLSADVELKEAVENISDAGISNQSLKRKHTELECIELEEGEIVDSDVDESECIGKNSLSTQKSSQSVQLQIAEQTNKKQRVSCAPSSENSRDSENNISEPVANVESFFMIDRKPSCLNELQLLECQDISEQVNNKNNVNNKATTLEKEEKGYKTNLKKDASETPSYSTENKALDKKFKCDFCPTVSTSKDKMFKHLQELKHYSASRVLVDEKGVPVKIIQKNGPRCLEAAFKGPVPICPDPDCSEIFRDIYSCVFHYKNAHNKAEPAYGLAELIGEDVIPCNKNSYDCEVCKEHCLSSAELFRHRKAESHIIITPRQDTQTMYFCCDCSQTFTNLNKVLKHRSKEKYDHNSDVRVLHVSVKRIKKKLLPFDQMPHAGQNAVETEIKHLQALYACSTTRRAGRQIMSKIRNLSKILS